MNINEISGIAQKIKRLESKQLNEEMTKNSLILPLFLLMGYDVFDVDEFVPEFTADFGTKRGERVDYAIKINGQPVILIEAKKLGTQLSSEHASQLFRYYGTTDAKIGILTNGNDYWFYTDSVKVNQMDQEPYLKIKISSMDEEGLQSLSYYSRDNIENANISEDVQLQRFRINVKEFCEQITTGNLSAEFIEYLAQISDVEGVEKAKLAQIFNIIYQASVSNPDLKAKQSHTNKTTETQPEVTHKKSGWNRDKMVELPIDTPLNYMEHNFIFHAPSKLIIKGEEIEATSFSKVFVQFIRWAYLREKESIKSDIINALKSKGYILTTSRSDDIRALKKIDDTPYFICTALNVASIIKGIYIIAQLIGIKDEEIQIVLAR